MRFDVVVLGGGVAGAAAAISAAQLGARTCIITGPPGASAMFSGAWRGECPEGLRRALTSAGYELRDCTAPLPHPHGHLIRCNAAPPSQQAAQIVENALVVGIAGLAGFDAALLAQRWSAISGVNLQSETVAIANTPAAGWAPASLAGQIERLPQLLIDPLEQAVKKHGAKRVILPPVLGTQYHDAARSAIAKALDAEIGEALAVPPSLPGWRLHHALRAALELSGVSLQEGKGLAAVRRDGRVEEVELLNGDVVAARAIVLATGKFASGGIEADTQFREPALGCPVWVEHLGERFEAIDALILTHPEMTEEQPLLGAGVHTDAEQRPLNASDDVVYQNVFVAGSIRAGWAVSTHSIGDAASDGWSAGTRAVSA